MHKCPKCSHEWSDAPAELALFEERGVALRRSKLESLRLVVDAYLRHHPRCKLGLKEQRMIEARLQDGWSAEELIEAIDGCHRSAWHCGENPACKKYQGLNLILRDSSHVQQFMEMPLAPQRMVKAGTPDDVEAKFLARFES